MDKELNASCQAESVFSRGLTTAIIKYEDIINLANDSMWAIGTLIGKVSRLDCERDNVCSDKCAAEWLTKRRSPVRLRRA